MPIKFFNTFILFCVLIISLLLWQNCTNSQEQSDQDQIPVNSATIGFGEQLFTQNCAACHNFKSRGIGPNLSGITREVSSEWLKQFIKNPPKMIEKGDERAVQLYEEYQNYMPAFASLDDKELEALLAYMHTYKKNEPVQRDLPAYSDPLDDPIPEKIEQSGILLTLEEVTQIPQSADSPPLARINKLLTVGKENPQIYLHDLRGKLYELKGKEARVFLDMPLLKEKFIDQPGLASGLGSFAFHQDYESNGLIYTTHTEPPNTAKADFTYADSIKVTLQWVLSELKQDQPGAATFSGSSRELLRIDMVSGVHGVQEITFNPFASKNDEDYGLLYMGVGDGGSVGERYPFIAHGSSQIWGSVVRIDPQGKNSQNGKYGIPSDNPFAKDGNSATLEEIWAHGFRNPHRINWFQGSETIMLITDIGHTNVEEINIGIPGGDYGWPVREGTFKIDSYGDLDIVYELEENENSSFVYPVAQYDHDEGSAISGGFVYTGNDIPILKGKYLFGDIVQGRIFFVESEELILGQQAQIQEIEIQFNGHKTNFAELTNNKRVDLRFGEGPEGAIFILTKADGKVWKVIDGNLQEETAGILPTNKE